MKKFIFISPGSETSKQMLADLQTYRAKDFLFIEEPYVFKNKLIKKMFEIYFKINSRIKLPFNKLWKNQFIINHLNFNNKDEYYVILGNGNFNYYSSDMLNEKKKEYNINYIVYFIDPLSGLMSNFMEDNIRKLEKKMVYTFDYKDSIKMNVKHTMNLYSKKNIEKGEVEKNSVYFVGTNKSGRVYDLNKIYQMMKNENIKCKFSIVNVEDKDKTMDGIDYNVRKSYDEVLNEIQSCECILEILQEGQSGVTLRYYEAISYNKKLITNNSLVKQLPYYNPSYMYIYENVEDIDMEWIKKDIKVDYNYDDRFSPVQFIEEIRRNVGV